MRSKLSSLLVEAAEVNPDLVVLTGDHGYQLFDELRKTHARQFWNCGIIEQAMVGIASGLARYHFKPIVYGLASFVPMRCLEQIKLDVCFPNLPVIFLGDGAGLVYSKLGASHHCAEDIAALRCMPNISIYSPADGIELADCFKEALENKGPSYIRIGKQDREFRQIALAGGRIFVDDIPTVGQFPGGEHLIVSTGSMTQIAQEIAIEQGILNASIYKLKPFPPAVLKVLMRFKSLLVIEEHNEYGGLGSIIRDELAKMEWRKTFVKSIALQDKFADKCGDWEYALSEHGLSDEQIRQTVKAYIGGHDEESNSHRSESERPLGVLS